MLRIFHCRSLLMSNCWNYSTNIPEKPAGKAKADLIFLKKENEVPVSSSLLVPSKSIAESKGMFIFV